MPKTVKFSELIPTLTYRGDKAEYTEAIRKSLLDDGDRIDLSALLENAGLEKTLWAFRALPPSEETAVRLLECDIVEKILEIEKRTNDFIIEDSYPYSLIEKSRSYANQNLDPEQMAKIESKETYLEAMRRRNARWAKIDPGLFSGRITKAAVETLQPEARLGAYFAINAAHSRRSGNGARDVLAEEEALKRQMLDSFLAN